MGAALLPRGTNGHVCARDRGSAASTPAISEPFPATTSMYSAPAGLRFFQA
ncbi:hypothetical protein RHDE110596_18275 [Prescottella defluvii]